MVQAMVLTAAVLTIVGGLVRAACALMEYKDRIRQEKIQSTIDAYARFHAITVHEYMANLDGEVRIIDPAGNEYVVQVAGKWDPPRTLKLMPPTDAQRYAWEWSAHLLQLIEEGQIRQARRDRRRLALTAIALAVVLRVRRRLRRAR